MGYFIKTGTDTTTYTAEGLAINADNLKQWEAAEAERVATSPARAERRAVIDAALAALPVAWPDGLAGTRRCGARRRRANYWLSVSGPMTGDNKIKTKTKET